MFKLPDSTGLTSLNPVFLKLPNPDPTCVFASQRMIAAVEDETKNDEHKRLGMFVLILMSHGDGQDSILGSDSKPVYLQHLYQMLWSTRFPHMAGKPKVVVVQACSGCKWDCFPVAIFRRLGLVIQWR